MSNIIYSRFVTSIPDLRKNQKEFSMMAKKVEELLMERSIESQRRILKNAKKMVKDCLVDDVYLSKRAKKAKTKETLKITLDELRARVHKNRA